MVLLNKPLSFFFNTISTWLLPQKQTCYVSCCPRKATHYEVGRYYFKHCRRRSRSYETQCHICTAVLAKWLMKLPFISEELGIPLSAFNVTVSNWLTVEPERKGLQQQNIGR